uniref:MADF domain-containing protein n=1 Tax=Glossina brevipalpis TaxID=37001 RepID=A0A1A9W2F0_9MUSC
MDLNIRIIEAVRNCPDLYKANGINLENRKETWRQLAERLGMKEQYLKLRWHSLVQRYQRDDNFKYRDKMKFLQIVKPKIVQSKTDPEFLITQSNISEKPKKEYVYVEVENFKKFETEHLCVVTSAAHSSQKPTTTTEDKCVKQESEIKHSTNLLAKDGQTTRRECINITETTSSLPIRRMEHEPQGKKYLNPVNDDRCEDDIFGELVTVMLKRMDEDKKRNVKKEIMNLLLT